MKGNVLDLAVAVVIDGAFGAIVTSLVKDVVMPSIGLLLGNVDFSNLFLSLNDQVYPTFAAAQEAGTPVIAYGQFVNTVINFLIVAAVIFLVVRAVAKMQMPVAPAPAPTSKDYLFCCSTIPVSAICCAHCTPQLGVS